jgi:acetyl esterase
MLTGIEGCGEWRLPSGDPTDTMVAMDDSPDSPRRQAPDSGSKAPGGTPGPTKAGATRPRVRPAKAAATRTSVGASVEANGERPRRGGTTAPVAPRSRATRATTTGATLPGDAGENGELSSPTGGRRWRRARNRALYNRRLQRASEHWPWLTRVGAVLLSHPDVVLGLLGRPAPIEVDGRVLNRSTQALLELANRFRPQPGTGGDVPVGFDPVAIRRQARLARLAMPVRTDVHVVGRVVPGPAGGRGLPVRIYRQFGTGIGADAAGRRPGAIVYYHGGGWVTGDLATHDAGCRLLAAVSGCLVVSVGYRLAPEHPFPAAVDDALAAYAWVQGHSDELGHAEGQVGVMGDSAGGNLAAAVALKTRPTSGRKGSGQAGLPPPIAQGLIYPALDARLDSASMRTFGDGFFLTRESMETFRASYLPDRELWETATVSPLLADDHRHLPPALVVTAGFDPLRDDGANYADALRRSGVEVEYRCYDDQVHGFMGMGVLADSYALATEVDDAMGRLMRRSMALSAGH